MTPSMALVFIVTGAAFVAFVTERFRADQVALAIPPLLLLGGVATVDEAIAGFADPATITVAAMLVLSLGLTKTGGVDWLARSIRGLGLPPRARLVLVLALAAATSPFLSNTAVVVVFLPVVLAFAREAGEPASRHLLPLSYAAILGGTVTLMGTSTNLVVHGMARSRGLDALHLFSIAPLGVVYCAVGLGFVLLLAPRVLPDRNGRFDLADAFAIRAFTTELAVVDGSAATARPYGDLDWEERYDVSLVGLHRDGADVWNPWPTVRLQAGDRVYVQGEAKALLALADAQGLATPAEHPAAEPVDDARMAEILVTSRSRLVGRTLRDADFRRRHGVTVLAIRRDGEQLRSRLHRSPLRAGDLLLVHGAAEDLDALGRQIGLVPLSEVEPHLDRPSALWAAGILAGVVAASAVGLCSLPAAAVVGVAVMVYTRCLRLDELYAEVDWRVVFLLAGLIPLGQAMERTGAAQQLTDLLVPALEGRGPVVAVLAVYLFTSVLTEVVSNNAAAVILTPVALTLAPALGMNPYALLVTIMFGASASFMTPTGYQTNALVFQAGGYTFTDYLRLGLPLNLLLAAVAALLIPVLWP